MKKGQSSFEYTILIVAVLMLVAVYAVSASRVISVRQQLNETQSIYANYSGDMLAKPNCRILFRKCGTGWGPGTSIAVDQDQDGELESYSYAYDTAVVRIRLLGYTKEGYPVYYAQAPEGGGGLAESIDFDAWAGQGFVIPEQDGKPGSQEEFSQQYIPGIAVNTNPANPSGQYHFYVPETGGFCPTDPFPLSQPGVEETCA